MITFCQFGAGRIGQIHADNIARRPDTCLRYVVDVNGRAAEALAARHGARAVAADEALADAEVDAVVVASSTDTHAELVERSARAGKAIFCEKPIDLSLARVEACLKVVAKARVPMLVGFNRRYDPSFSSLEAAVRSGAVGDVEQVVITSRDPAPPPPAYVKVSGGLFRDMMIHDFDMARFLLGEDPVEVYATASCLVDRAIGRAGDVDTAMVILRTRRGAQCQISNSRRASYGYDQRIEVFGSKGMVQAGNRTPTTVELSTAAGVIRDKPLYFFLERYGDAYRAELEHFVQVVRDRIPPRSGGEDGRMALVLAECALQSLESGGAVGVPSGKGRAAG